MMRFAEETKTDVFDVVIAFTKEVEQWTRSSPWRLADKQKLDLLQKRSMPELNVGYYHRAKSFRV